MRRLEQLRRRGLGQSVERVVRREQRIDDTLRPPRNRLRAFIHKLGVGHGHVFTRHDLRQRAAQAHLQILRVFRVVAHVRGAGERPQPHKLLTRLRRLPYHGQCGYLRNVHSGVHAVHTMPPRIFHGLCRSLPCAVVRRGFGLRDGVGVRDAEHLVRLVVVGDGCDRCERRLAQQHVVLGVPGFEHVPV